MLKTLAQRMRRVAGATNGARKRSDRPRDASLSLRVPSPYGGRPWVTATVALSFVPYGYGETLRLRSHVDGCLRWPADGGRGQTLEHDTDQATMFGRGRRAAASIFCRAVDRLPPERLTALTSRRWRSWLDIQFSTAPLDAGAAALTPEPLRRIVADGLPRAGAGRPRAGFWSGPAGGHAGGVARLVLMQFDETDAGHDRARKSASGFNMNACLAQVVEPAGAGDDESDAGRA